MGFESLSETSLQAGSLVQVGENFGGKATSVRESKSEQASGLLIFEYSAFAVYDERSYLIGQK